MSDAPIAIDFLVTASQIVTVSGERSSPRPGFSMGDLQVLTDAAIAVHEGKIVKIGAAKDLKREFAAKEVREFHGHCLTPGLVDCHTHLVFAGSREQDFYERLKGVSYEEIARRGGGIRYSVRQLRAASSEELERVSLQRLQQILRHGTTTCEVKSGYGLNLADEVKTLEVIERLRSRQPVGLVSTFLGAHEVPDEFREQRDAYIDLLMQSILPQIAQRKLARYCDIFCEKDVFSIDESRRILLRARELGFELKLHADELTENFGGAQLAAQVKAVSADHLLTISEAGINALAQSTTMAVLLPATTFFLGKSKYAPARRMIEKGVALALATDLNPGSSNTESLQAVMTLAAVHLKMSPEEILTAVTHNAACAIGESERVGRLAPGLWADLVVWDVPDFRQIPYHFGGNRVAAVFKEGEQVFLA